MNQFLIFYAPGIVLLLSVIISILLLRKMRWEK